MLGAADRSCWGLEPLGRIGLGESPKAGMDSVVEEVVNLMCLPQAVMLPSCMRLAAALSCLLLQTAAALPFHEPQHVRSLAGSQIHKMRLARIAHMDACMSWS